MALDFHKLDDNEFLFGLDDKQYAMLYVIFESFNHWTGMLIDQYSDTKLSIEHQKTLIKIIDAYVNQTDLNQNKENTVCILEFRGLLMFFVKRNWALILLGD